MTIVLPPAGANTHPAALYAAGLEQAAAGGGDVLRWARPDGDALPVTRWLALPSPAETALLAALAGPVLDVGCGPARHVLALQGAGVAALGLDVSAAVVRLARRRGAAVHHGSVFDPVPDTGAWGAAVLLDGNLGIGGDPVRLLRRVHTLLRPGGEVLAEFDPGVEGIVRERPRLELAGGRSRPFAWARVGPDAVARLADAAGLQAGPAIHAEQRVFAVLHRPPVLTTRC